MNSSMVRCAENSSMLNGSTPPNRTSRHQYLAQTVQSHPTPSGVKYAPARSRNLAQTWPIEMGLDKPTKASILRIRAFIVVQPSLFLEISGQIPAKWWTKLRVLL